MKKNGFVFVETMIVVAILVTALILLYGTFSSVLQSEKKRIHYDDVAFMYRSFNIAKVINNSYEDKITEYIISNSLDFLTIGSESPAFDATVNKDSLNQIFNDLDVYQAIVVQSSKLNKIKKCISENSLSQTCIMTQVSLSDGMKNYIKTLSFDDDEDMVLIVEYNDPLIENNKYYSWVSV